MTYLQKCILIVIIMLLSVGFVMVYSTSTIVSAEDSAADSVYRDRCRRGAAQLAEFLGHILHRRYPCED